MRASSRISLSVTFLIALLLLATNAVVRADTPPGAGFLTQFKGKVVLLDFWASWCQPCRQSFPWMNGLEQRYGSAGLVVVAVNLDQDRQLAQEFLTAVPATFRIDYDPQGALASQFNVVSMPTSFLIDRSGRVREQHRGFRQAQTTAREQTLVQLLKE